MIELFEKDSADTKIKSSKGNQLKWHCDGFWYKADNNGYEGLSEYVVSKLLEKSNLNENEFVKYEIEEISYKNTKYLGCKSRDFLKKGQRLITLQRLCDSVYGKNPSDVLDEIYNKQKKCEVLVDIVETLTGIQYFGEYLLKLLTIDALFLNEDRHFHNIAFIEENGKFSTCPIFDNGAALLSDTRFDYPLDGNELRMINEVKSKTVIDDFSEQLTNMKILYRSDIEFYFTDEDIVNIVNEAVEYDEKVKKRVIRILTAQRQKYQSYFKKQ